MSDDLKHPELKEVLDLLDEWISLQRRSGLRSIQFTYNIPGARVTVQVSSPKDGDQ